MWLGEKKIWISGPEPTVEPTEPNIESFNGGEKIERPSHLFEQKYSKRREPLELPVQSNTSLDDSTMPSDDSSSPVNEVCIHSPEPESLEISDPNSSMNR